MGIVIEICLRYKRAPWTLFGVTKNPKRELLKRGENLSFPPDFLSMANRTALLPKTLRNLPFLVYGFHLIIQDGSTVPGGRKENKMKKRHRHIAAVS